MPHTAPSQRALRGVKPIVPAAASKGFTLIELLVVVAIIAMLIAILLPSMARARFVADVAVCGARMHQWSLTLNAYAVSNKGWYPVSRPVGAINVIDLDPDIVSHFRNTYDLPLEMFFCPLRPDEYSTETFLNNAPTLRTMGYGYWAPRVYTNGNVHHFADASGPARITENNRNPIWTDALLEFPSWGWPTIDTFSRIWGGSHEFNGRMENTNVLQPDASVENRPVDLWEFRYQSGNARTWY